MKKKYRQKRILGIATLLIMAGTFQGALAEEQEESAESVSDKKIEIKKNLTGTEQISWINDNNQKVNSAADRVEQMLEQARKEKDTLKIDCLDDKLTQIKVNLAGVEERIESLKLAVQKGDQSSANQQFTILQLYVFKIEGLEAEAENCVGETDVLFGKTETILTIDDNITPKDPIDIVPDILVNPDPYPPASGYL